MVVALVPDDRRAAIRRALRAHCRPGQRSLHFHAESESRRRQLLDALTTMGIAGLAYRARVSRDLEASRRALLERIVRDLHRNDVRALVIESRDDRDRLDRSTLYRTVQIVGPIEYLHRRKHEEPLLWIADGLAWALGRGGHWRDQAAKICGPIVEVDP
jgi:hypothetical protein